MEILAKRSLQDAARLLADLTHPDGVVHVGVGMGAGDMHCWRDWDIPNALLIDANEKRLKWALRLAEATPGWHAQAAVLSEADQEVRLFEASNAAESGLVDPRHLAALWPNLRASGSSMIRSASLDSLLSQQQYARLRNCERPWLVVDCLPAARILKGAQHFLERCSAVWVRVLLEPAGCEGAHLTDLDHLFDELGYTKLRVEEGNHPALGEALFVRDWQRWYAPQLKALTEENGQSHVALADAKSQVEALSAEVGALTMQKAALEGVRLDLERAQGERKALLEQLEAVSSEGAAIRAARDALAQEKAELSEALDAQIKLAADRQVQLDAANKARDEQAALATQRQTQIEALAAEKAALQKAQGELKATRDALANEKAEVIQARDAQAKLAAERQAQLEAASKARDEQAALAAQRQSQIEALAAEKAALQKAQGELTAAHDALAKENIELIQARDGQARLAAERLAQLDAATKAHGEVTAVAAQRKSQLEVLAVEKESLQREHADLISSRNVLANENAELAEARDAQTKLATERQVRMEALAAAREELAALATQQKLTLDTLNAEKVALEQAVAELAAAHEAVAKEKAEIASDREVKEKLLTELQADLRTSNTTIVEHARLIELQRAQIEKLALDNVALEKRCADLSAACDNLTSVRADLESALSAQTKIAVEGQSQLTAVAEERDGQASVATKLQGQLEALTTEMRGLERSRQELNAQCDALRQELMDARRSAAISLRLQALREADLQELQTRYKHSVKMQERQHRMLLTLSERVSLGFRGEGTITGHENLLNESKVSLGEARLPDYKTSEHEGTLRRPMEEALYPAGTITGGLPDIEGSDAAEPFGRPKGGNGLSDEFDGGELASRSDSHAYLGEPIRVIHHLACTGGTLISKCIAAMPNTQLISEVDPLSTMQDGQGGPRFAPTDMIQLLRQSTRGASPDLLLSLFLSDLEVARREAMFNGQRLVLRDHAHSHFCVGAEVPNRPTLRTILASRFPVVSLLTVRDPIDSYLALKSNNFMNFFPQTFEEYCKRYIAFLDAYKNVPIVKYEDFVDSPQEVMRRICDFLKLSFSEHFPDLFGIFKLTGDSGRSSERIERRSRRAIDTALAMEIDSSDSHRLLRDRLAYD